MSLLRMILVAWRLAWPEVCTPWRSSLLRWRMETYGVLDEDGHLLHADAISPWRFFWFLVTEQRALRRFLRWAAWL